MWHVRVHTRQSRAVRLNVYYCTCLKRVNTHVCVHTRQIAYLLRHTFRFPSIFGLSKTESIQAARPVLPGPTPGTRESPTSVEPDLFHEDDKLDALASCPPLLGLNLMARCPHHILSPKVFVSYTKYLFAIFLMFVWHTLFAFIFNDHIIIFF